VKLRAGITGEGISLRFGEQEPARLEPSPTADQISPKKFYVYGHFDERGRPFYIGKGTGRRAWQGDRHPYWHRYVKDHLNSKYSVVILADNLDSDQAEEIENSWMVQESQTLVNWINFGRKTDFSALDKFHKLREQNLAEAAKARAIEKSDPECAADIYLRCLERIDEYAYIQAELGLVGQLIDEERRENGIRGEIHILDRLTLCLVRSGKRTEAERVTGQYFDKYKADEALAIAIAINKRIGKVPKNGGYLPTSSGN